MDTTKLIEEIRGHVYKHGPDATVERYGPALAAWPGGPAGIWLRVSTRGPAKSFLMVASGATHNVWQISPGQQRVARAHACSISRLSLTGFLACQDVVADQGAGVGGAPGEGKAAG